MQQRQKLEETGIRILEAVRTELYLSMRFMGPALASLGMVMDLSTASVGTDAAYIRFHPSFLMQLYLEHPRRLNRTYLHMILHCLLRHMFLTAHQEDTWLWDLSCDIAVEAMIDTMDYPPVFELVTDRRAAIYRQLEDAAGILSAQRIYHYLEAGDIPYRTLMAWEQEFHRDDHSFWMRMDDNAGDDTQDGIKPPSAPRQGPDSKNPEQDDHDSPSREPSPEQRQGGGTIKPDEDTWKKNAEKLKAELENAGSKASDKTGSLTRILSFEQRTQTDYRKFLERFRVIREEAAIDMDSFDYGFYNYGMELYGNMPLIEENEYREAKLVEELVIAIDTSASCQAQLVQRFLNETAAILFAGDQFFKKVNIHIVSCDDQVQSDTKITNTDEMRRYADGFALKGGYGTDFRPVFTYVEQLRRQKDLTNLRGLIYFTDGFGTYPKHPTDYDTAFLFPKDEECGDGDAPAWALKLFI